MKSFPQSYTEGGRAEKNVHHRRLFAIKSSQEESQSCMCCRGMIIMKLCTKIAGKIILRLMQGM